MKTTEQRSQAFAALLKQVERNPVTLTYRGVNDKDQPLYEIKYRAGGIICEKATEKELMDTLRGESK